MTAHKKAHSDIELVFYAVLGGCAVGLIVLSAHLFMR